MSRKFKVWLDSGANANANAYSTRSITISLEELGYTEELWGKLSEEYKEEIMRDIAFEQSDWGWKELENIC